VIQGRSPARRWLTTEVVGLARGWWLLIGFVVAPLLLWLAKSAYDASAVESELPPRTVGSLEAPDTTAEDRAYEAIRGKGSRNDGATPTTKTKRCNSADDPGAQLQTSQRGV